jgi:hypothetical protein
MQECVKHEQTATFDAECILSSSLQPAEQQEMAAGILTQQAKGSTTATAKTLGHILLADWCRC